MYTSSRGKNTRNTFAEEEEESNQDSRGYYCTTRLFHHPTSSFSSECRMSLTLQLVINDVKAGQNHLLKSKIDLRSSCIVPQARTRHGNS